jgi:hypothetical protein
MDVVLRVMLQNKHVIWRDTDCVGDRLGNEEALQGVKAERDILHATDISKGKWVGHILRGICLLKRIILGKKGRKIIVTEWRGKRRRQLVDDLNEMRG